MTFGYNVKVRKHMLKHVYFCPDGLLMIISSYFLYTTFLQGWGVYQQIICKMDCKRLKQAGKDQVIIAAGFDNMHACAYAYHLCIESPSPQAI